MKGAAAEKRAAMLKRKYIHWVGWERMNKHCKANGLSPDTTRRMRSEAAAAELAAAGYEV